MATMLINGEKTFRQKVINQNKAFIKVAEGGKNGV